MRAPRRRSPWAVAALLAVLLAGPLLPAAAAQAPVPPRPDTPAYEYHTYATLTADLQALAAAHPDLASLTSLGQTRSGLDLWSLEIGNRSDPDYARLPGFYLDGGHHGNEALGIEAAYLFAEGLLEGYASDPAARALVDDHRTFVTPLVNPEGKTANTRQNGALVNLNRNYPFHWNERGTGPVGDGNYAGPSEGSEPEVQATMAALRERNVSVYATLHTGSYDLVRPFGHAPDQAVPDEAVYQQLFAWAGAEAGLTSRWPGGSGESLCWAYGALGVFSVLLEVHEFDVRPEGTPQALLGPLTKEEVLAGLDPHLRTLRHLLGRAGDWGGHVVASIDGEGERGVLALRNTGFGPARNLRLAATGLELLAPLPRELAPDQDVRIPIALDAPALVRVDYEPLAVVPTEEGRGKAFAEAEVEFHSGSLDPRGTPGAEPVAFVALIGAVVWALGGRPRPK